MSQGFMKDTIKIAISNLFIIISGIVTGLILPRILGVTDYGLYKTFNLYTTYVVFLDLGLTNGIYLEYGGEQRDNLPKEKFRMYFKLLLILQVGFAGLIALIALYIFNTDYKFIFAMVAIYGIANNITNYYEKISVMIGEFTATVRRNILKSILSILIVFVLWICVKVFQINSPYKLYTIMFTGVYVFLAYQYCAYYNEISVGNSCDFTSERKNVLRILSSGFVLLLGDTIASLILNLDRQFVSMLFDIRDYSLYAFAYSMLKIVVLAVSAISTVLYPALKRMSTNELKESYHNFIPIVGIISFGCLLGYYPLCFIVHWILPSYKDSLPVFRVLFPSISINMVITMVMVNHFKALQRQREYLIISIIIFFVAITTNFVAYWIYKMPITFSYASMVTIFIWYVVLDAYLARNYKSKEPKQYIYLAFNTIVFFAVSRWIQNYFLAFLLNLVFFVVGSYVIYRDSVVELLDRFKRLLLKK